MEKKKKDRIADLDKKIECLEHQIDKKFTKLNLLKMMRCILNDVQYYECSFCSLMFPLKSAKIDKKGILHCPGCGSKDIYKLDPVDIDNIAII